MAKIYDTAIIGGGPAGFSAALNLKRRGKEILWFGDKGLGAKVEKAEEIVNYPGMGRVTGSELNRRFTEHMQEMDLVLTEQRVTNILMTEGIYRLLAGEDIYEARTVLLAVGATEAKSFRGEKEYVGRGVSTCATCDGNLYKGKTIAVFCEDPSEEDEVRYLAELADHVYLDMPRRKPPHKSSQKPPQKPDQMPPSIQRVMDGMPENVELLPDPIEGVEGYERVESIVLKDGTHIAVDGVFCLRSAASPEELLPNLSLDGPNIVVGRSMETNLPGCYAAGDCTGMPYQIAVAVGEGNTAAHGILKFLNG